MYVGFDSIKLNARKQIEINGIVDEMPTTIVLHGKSPSKIKFLEKDEEWFKEEMRLAKLEYRDAFEELEVLTNERLKFASNFLENANLLKEVTDRMRTAATKIAHNELILLAMNNRAEMEVK